MFHGRRLAEEFHWASNSSESLRLGNITNTQCKKIGSDLEAWAVALANVLRIEHNNILHVCIDQLKSMSSIGFSFGRSKIGTLKFEPVGEGFHTIFSKMKSFVCFIDVLMFFCKFLERVRVFFYYSFFTPYLALGARVKSFL